MITAEKLCLCYDKKNVVSDFDFTVRPGEIVSLIGPNGSGKSTVLKAIARLMKCSYGVVHLDGRDIYKLPTREVATKLSILSQVHTSPPDFTVRELVSYGRIPHQKWYETLNSEDREIVEWAIAQTRLEQFADRTVNSLSGGERQRAWIALALAQRPQVLLLDEPTTFLDICHQIEVLELVKELNATLGLTVIMVLHDMNHAAAYSHRLVVIKDGRKVAEGTPCHVLTPALLRDVYNVQAEIALHPLTGKLYFHALGLACTRRELACNQVTA